MLSVWQIQVLLFGIFWIFFLNIFDLWLAKSPDAKPADMEGRSGIYNVHTCTCLESTSKADSFTHSFNRCMWHTYYVQGIVGARDTAENEMASL